MSAPPFGLQMRQEQFSHIEPILVFLNHGSRGMVPKQVKDKQNACLDDYDSNPDEFLGFTKRVLYNEACDAVAPFLGTTAGNIAIVENATKGINSVLKSVTFQSGDAILCNNLTYISALRTIEFITRKTPGLQAVIIDHQYPIVSTQQVIQEYTDALDANPNIKLTVIDHMSSMPPILFPVVELTQLCQSRGVMVFIDGAHAPGQVDLNLDQLGADFYIGNLHKWLFSPRGCAVLHVIPARHDLIEPCVTSVNNDDPYPNNFYQQGTRDEVPKLMAKAALDFYNWAGGTSAISSYCTDLSGRTADMLVSAWGTNKMQVPPEMEAPFMKCIRVPDLPDYPKTNEGVSQLTSVLRQSYNMWVSIMLRWEEMWFRLSTSIYCQETDFDKLRDAILELKDGTPAKYRNVKKKYDLGDMLVPVDGARKGRTVKRGNPKSKTCIIL